MKKKWITFPSSNSHSGTSFNRLQVKMCLLYLKLGVMGGRESSSTEKDIRETACFEEQNFLEWSTQRGHTIVAWIDVLEVVLQDSCSTSKFFGFREGYSTVLFPNFTFSELCLNPKILNVGFRPKTWILNTHNLAQSQKKLGCRIPNPKYESYMYIAYVSLLP